MNTRLQRFLELEQLSPSRLADILGIQRSGISHILSGRNKPGYDFFYKMNKRFPTLNLEWLISGNGKIYKDLERNLFDNDVSNRESYIENQAPHSGQLFVTEVSEEEIPSAKAPENYINDNESENPSIKKSLVKMILIYSDGTFKELNPTE